MARVQAMVVRDGRVLMVRHRHRGEAYWCLLGGALEPGETPAEGALCERDAHLLDRRARFPGPGRRRVAALGR